MDDRLSVQITMVTTNAAGKKTVGADVELKEMKLADTIKVEQALLATLGKLLEEQNVT